MMSRVDEEEEDPLAKQLILKTRDILNLTESFLTVLYGQSIAAPLNTWTELD